jgi:small subunit ribosomal protein S21
MAPPQGLTFFSKSWLGLYSHIHTRRGGELRVAEVVIQEGESLENALRRFKRKVQQEDIIKEIKKHSFYMKPGEKRRAKQALSRKRLRKKQRREQD